MTLGELHFVENTTLDLEAVVRQAASDYERKYGESPDLCLVHPNLLAGPARQVAGLRLESAGTVLPNYLWIGVGEAADTMPVAQ